MGLDTIMFYGTAAAAQTALAPTSAVIKGTSGDAFIVGYNILAGSDNQVTLTCPGDPRWEAAGFHLHTGGPDSAAASSGGYSPIWLENPVPIRQGATLVSTQIGADDCYTAVYVQYPQFGEAFKVRSPVSPGSPAFRVSKTFTAGAAVTAFTIAVNSASATDFQRGKSYTPVMVENSGAMTTPFWVGIQNTKTNLATFWLVPNTPLVQGNFNLCVLPYGLGTVDGGETQFVHILSTTAETPVARITYAYA